MSRQHSAQKTLDSVLAGFAAVAEARLTRAASIDRLVGAGETVPQEIRPPSLTQWRDG
jgi:hypothetical protein